MPQKKSKKKQIDSHKKEILGILLISLGILILMSLLSYDAQEQPANLAGSKIQNRLGIAGVYISYFLIVYGIGYASVVLPITIIILGWNLVVRLPLRRSFRLIGYLLAFSLYTSIILAMPEITQSTVGASSVGYSLSGLIGGIVAEKLFNFVGIAGSIVILLSLIMITLIGATRVSVGNIFLTLSEQGNFVFGRISRFVNQKIKQKKSTPRKIKEKTGRLLGKSFSWKSESGDGAQQEIEQSADELSDLDEELGSFDFSADDVEEKPRPKIPIRKTKLDLMYDDVSKPLANQLPEQASELPNVPINRYIYPPLDILDAPKNNGPVVKESELNANARILEDRLMEFGVEGRVIEIHPGPVITRYDIEPAPGVKISRIVGLSDDLALGMRAKRIRIVAPVPGKGAVGIEIPNRIHSTVYLREILSSKAFRNSESPLTVALGKTISGEPFVTTLEKMPHLLIAGATGSGKSVCLNSIIASILFKAHPTQVQFAMIDPKRLELTVFNDLRSHHLTYKEDLNEEVATSAENAISILKSMCVLMDQRYEILARAGVRNIADYMTKLQAGKLQHLEHEEPYEPLPYIVVIVDELADLMLTSAREIEEPIARLAQMSRAVGIHLILATQRPSVNVITGVIKANFPSRIAFQVASKTDSRTILDLNGAEKLLGRGDMLFISQGSSETMRIHGAFVSIDEVEAMISHIRKQAKYPKRTLPIDEDDKSDPLEPGEGGGPRDALFNHALKLVVRHQQGSISLVQRRLSIGYARAARIIDQLEMAGVVGPYDGSKAREVLIDEEELKEFDLG